MYWFGLLFPGFQFPVWTTPNPSREPPVTRISEKDNAWLYSLDPILVTIIVMSSLGVLFGSVCAGLLLYCACSYNGLSSRSTTTLENYNFELYDGIKHKVKINQQRCCSEAWWQTTRRGAVSARELVPAWSKTVNGPQRRYYRADLWPGVVEGSLGA